MTTTYHGHLARLAAASYWVCQQLIIHWHALLEARWCAQGHSQQCGLLTPRYRDIGDVDILDIGALRYTV